MINKQIRGAWDRMLVPTKMLKFCKYTKECFWSAYFEESYFLTVLNILKYGPRYFTPEALKKSYIIYLCMAKERKQFLMN